MGNTRCECELLRNLIEVQRETNARNELWKMLTRQIGDHGGQRGTGIRGAAVAHGAAAWPARPSGGLPGASPGCVHAFQCMNHSTTSHSWSPYGSWSRVVTTNGEHFEAVEIIPRIGGHDCIMSGKERELSFVGAFSRAER